MAGSSSEVEHTGDALRVLLDTNVVLDWLLDRLPWSDAAQPLWKACDVGLVVGYLPASALTDIFYIARRQIGLAGANDAVDRCLVTFEILPVDKALLLSARALPGSDFEDNVCISCARVAQLTAIVTRNLRDFAHAGLPVIEPPGIVPLLPAR